MAYDDIWLVSAIFIPTSKKKATRQAYALLCNGQCSAWVPPRDVMLVLGGSATPCLHPACKMKHAASSWLEILMISCNVQDMTHHAVFIQNML